MALVSMDTFSTCLKSTAKKHHQIIVLPEYNHRKLLPCEPLEETDNRSNGKRIKVTSRADQFH